MSDEKSQGNIDEEDEAVGEKVVCRSSLTSFKLKLPASLFIETMHS
jgi:hypothetical protein